MLLDVCGENFTITCFFLLLQPRGNKISGNRRTGELEDHIGHSFGFAWLLNRTKVGIKTVSTAILKDKVALRWRPVML